MKTIQKMFEHLNWANHRILEAIQGMTENQKEVIALFSHILFAEQVWLTRIQGLDSSGLPIWADADITVCTELAKKNDASITAFLANLTESDLDKWIVYKNSSGKEFEHSIRDILTHVGLHGHYHRGQINLRLRSNGYEPVSVDYITFVR